MSFSMHLHNSSAWITQSDKYGDDTDRMLTYETRLRSYV